VSTSGGSSGVQFATTTPPKRSVAPRWMAPFDINALLLRAYRRKNRD